MVLKRSFWFWLWLLAWPIGWAQPVVWPEAPERTVWLAADREAFGNGVTANTPLNASTATKLGQALERLTREIGLYELSLIHI